MQYKWYNFGVSSQESGALVFAIKSDIAQYNYEQ